MMDSAVPVQVFTIDDEGNGNSTKTLKFIIGALLAIIVILVIIIIL